MRILIVSEFIPYPILGGLARHCITLGNQLLRMGHDVSIMGNSEFAITAYVERLGFNGDFISGFQLNRRLSDRIERRIGVYPYPLYKHFAMQIAKAINKNARKYDVVHYHGHYPMVANFVDSNINFVQTIHDHGTFCLNKYFFRGSNCTECTAFEADDCAHCFNPYADPLRRMLTKKGCLRWRDETISALCHHKTIFVSERALNIALKGLGTIRPDTISVVHNSIDTDDIISKLEYINIRKESSDNAINGVLLASTLGPAKGVHSFLTTYRDGQYIFPVTIAGSGSELPLMQEQFKGHSVDFKGWLSHEQVLNQMLIHRAFVVSSLSEETGPITALEAMFLNKPVFALRRGGILELNKYERYNGQVTLYDTMDELLTGVFAATANGHIIFNMEPLNAEFGASISNKVVEIINLYNR